MTKSQLRTLTSPNWRNVGQTRRSANFPGRSQSQAGRSMARVGVGSSGQQSNSGLSASATSSTLKVLRSDIVAKTSGLSRAQLRALETVTKNGGPIAALDLLRLMSKAMRRANWLLDLLEIILRRLDEYYREQAGVRREGGEKISGAWQLITQCPYWDGTRPGWVFGSTVWPPNSSSIVKNCLAGQGMVNAPWIPGQNQVIYGFQPNPVTGRYRLGAQFACPPDQLTEPEWTFAPNTLRAINEYNPYEFFDADLSSPGRNAAQEWVPPVRTWTRPPSEKPQGRKVGEAARIVDEVNPVERWVFKPNGKREHSIKPENYSDRAPPGRNVREKKIKVAAAGAALRIYNIVTETKDFVDAWWDAIPREHRSAKFWKPGMKKASSPRLPQKLSEIWDYFSYLQSSGRWSGPEGQKYLNNAITNVGVNEVKDYIYGRIGQTSGKASAAVGRPHGFQMGPVF